MKWKTLKIFIDIDNFTLYNAFLFLISYKEGNVTKSKDHGHKATIQRTQSGHGRGAYDINNRSAKSVSGNEII